MTKPKNPNEENPEIPFFMRSDLFFGPGGVRKLSDPFPIAPQTVQSEPRKRSKPPNGKQRRLRVRQPGEDYTPTELALEWGLSTDKIRELFRNEPGVKKIQDPAAGKKRKRRYVTLRIPEAVAERVARRLS